MVSKLPQKTIPFVTAILFLVPGISLAVLTAIHYDFMKFCFYRLSYFLMALLVIAWVVVCIQQVQSNPISFKSVIHRYRTGVIFSFLVTGAIFISVEPQFRILSDETNLLSISKTMFFDRDIRNVNLGKWYHFNYQYLELVDPKRPFLFPFFMNLLHLLFGYRSYHPFVVNFLGLGIILSLVFGMIKKHLGKVAAFAGVMFIAAQPVVTQTAASAGIDLVAVVFLVICFKILDSFLENPSPQNFTWLWVNLLMLAHTRYETPLYVVVILTGLFWFGLIKLEYFRSSFIYPLTPLVLLPVLWQRFFMTFEWQAPPDVPAFSLDHFVKHHGHFFQSLTQFDFFLPYASVINIIAIVSFVYFAFLFMAKKWPRQAFHKQFVIIAFVVFGVYWILTNAYYHDSIVTPDGARLYTFSAIVFSVLATMFFFRWPAIIQKPFYGLLIAVFLFTLYHPVSIENRFSNSLARSRDYRMVLNFLKKQDPPNFLLITDRTGLYTVHDYGAVTFTYARNHKEELLREFNQHLYSDIFVVQEIDDKTRKPFRGTALDDDFKLESVFEIQKRPKPLSSLRISRVLTGGAL